jgi:teichuronic acid exporter
MKSIKPFFWSFLNTGGSQAIGFLASIIIARLAMPSDFGIFVICSSIILIFNIFSEGGLSSIIVIDKNFCDKKASNILSIIMLISVSLFCILIFFSSNIANFFKQEVMSVILPIMALSILSNAFGSVHAAIIVRNLQFKQKAVISLSSTIVASIIGIIVAFQYDPLFGLVIIFTLTPLLISLCLWMTVRWNFNFTIKPLLTSTDLYFAFNLASSNLLDQGSKSTLIFIFNSTFGTANLGFFNRAEAIKNLASQTIDKVVQRVSFPLLAKKNHTSTKNAFIESTRISFFLILLLLPLTFFISFYSDEIIMIVYGPNWGKSSSILSVLIFCGLFSPLTSLNVSLMKSTGHSKSMVINKIFAFILVPLIFLVSYEKDVYYFLYFLVVYFIFLYILSIFTIKRISSVNLLYYFRSISIACLISITSVIVFYSFAKNLELGMLFNIINFIITVGIIYFISWKLHNVYNIPK